jgi:hypothetical protein
MAKKRGIYHSAHQTVIGQLSAEKSRQFTARVGAHKTKKNLPRSAQRVAAIAV